MLLGDWVKNDRREYDTGKNWMRHMKHIECRKEYVAVPQ